MSLAPRLNGWHEYHVDDQNSPPVQPAVDIGLTSYDLGHSSIDMPSLFFESVKLLTYVAAVVMFVLACVLWFGA